MVNDTWQHKFEATRPYPKYGPKYKITVEAGLHKFEGDAHPYFSVTGHVWKPGARDWECCGCLHDLLVEQWPELAPVIALHLSDDTGTPMHAEANSWYQLAGYYGGAGEQYHAGNSKGTYDGEYRTPKPEECLAQFADYVRIPVDEAQTLAEQWRCDDDPKASRRWFGEWIKAQAPRWDSEALAARQVLDKLREGV